MLDWEESEEEEDDPELAEVKLDTDEALDRNEKVESFVFALISCFSQDTFVSFSSLVEAALHAGFLSQL